jgi:hypothetical protein
MNMIVKKLPKGSRKQLIERRLINTNHFRKLPKGSRKFSSYTICLGED